MSWLRRVLTLMRLRWALEDLPPVIASVDRVDLARAKVDQCRILTRADVAIAEAMAHADQIFVTRERRRKRR